MEHHLDHKVVLGTEPEHKGLYKWFLSEAGEKTGKYSRDQIPWSWSQYFTLTDIRLISGAKVESERESDSAKIADTEKIVAQLRPGHVMNDRYHRDTVYSMFGTNRSIKEFELHISKATDEKKQGCAAWGSVSYTTEIDFRTDTQPDSITFYLMVNEEAFNRYVQLVRERSTTSASFRVGNVDGFYSDWSPSISTAHIKVLTSYEKDHPVEIPDGCEIIPPRLGRIGEAELFLYSEQRFNLPPVDDFDDGSENDIQTGSVGSVQSSNACPSTQIADARVIATLKSLRFAAWLIAGLLLLILLK